MTFEEIREVRVLRGGDARQALAAQPDRTPAQKHTDEALDHADTSALGAATAFGESLEWAASIGVEIPLRVRGVVTILRQWQKHLEDERKRRG